MDPLAVPRAIAGRLLRRRDRLGGRWRRCCSGEPLARIGADRSGRNGRLSPRVRVNLALWAAFQVLDEVFLAYQPEQVHRAIFLNQIATIVLLAVLPNMGDNSRSRRVG